MPNFKEIDSSYNVLDLAATQGWTVTEVPWHAFSRFHADLKGFEALLKQLDLADEWAAQMGRWKRLRYFLATTPLPPQNIQNQIATWSTLQALDLNHLVRHLSANLAEAYERLIASFKHLMEESENPLFSTAYVDNEQSSGGSIAVYCSEARLATSVSCFLDRHPTDGCRFAVVRPPELKKLAVCRS